MSEHVVKNVEKIKRLIEEREFKIIFQNRESFFHLLWKSQVLNESILDKWIKS